MKFLLLIFFLHILPKLPWNAIMHLCYHGTEGPAKAVLVLTTMLSLVLTSYDYNSMM